MSRNITLFQDCPGEKKPYFLSPIGKYLNKELQKARPGDFIIFQNGWRREKRKLARICRIEISSPVFTFLLRSIHGETASINGIKEKWADLSVLEGFGRDGVDMDACILGEVETIEPEDVG